jgi:hypothetical protein
MSLSLIFVIPTMIAAFGSLLPHAYTLLLPELNEWAKRSFAPSSGPSFFKR